MRDPFPSPPLFLTTTLQPLSTSLGLHTLPAHIHEIFLAYAFYQFTLRTISPYVSRALFPQTYASLSAAQRINWHVHFVSMVQSLFINGLALWVIRNDRERGLMDWSERVWGYTGATGMVQGFAAGYFLWDLVVSLQDVAIHGWGAVVHATSAAAVSLLGFRPFVNYYGLNFILYELSTPFLNIHWALDKFGLTGSTAQAINGAFLILSFGASRLVWGNYQAVMMYRDVVRAIETPGESLPVPTWLAVSYLVSIGVLSLLNFWWFGKMIQTVLSRFQGPSKKGTGKKGAAELKKKR